MRGVRSRLMGFLVRAVGRRIGKALDEFSQSPEGKSAIERSHQSMAVADMAEEVAGSDWDDVAACAQLRERLPEDREAVEGAVEHLGGLRTSFVTDRAYRLLTAALDGTSVRPIDPAVRDQFSAEAQLGRMSLTDAFQSLVELEPRLYQHLMQGSDELRPMQSGWSTRSEPRLVGAWADSPHPVVNTDLAANIVSEYEAVTSNGRAADTDPTPFFDRKKRTHGGSFALFGKGDTRPRATN
jgi:hypothetical protein